MKHFLIFVFICYLSQAVSAQTNKYFDSPFGGGGGFIPAWYFPNVDPLNVKLKEAGIPQFSANGLLTTGGAGFIYIGFVKNLRIGGMGFSGSTSEKASIGNFDYEVEYSIGGGGLTVEYTLPFIKDIGVSLGAILGAGSISIDNYRNSADYSWENVWNNNPDNSYSRLTNSYWIITPTINVDIPVYRFIALRIGAGYQFTAGSEWVVNNEQSVTGIPDELNGDAFFVQAGILVGFFAF